MATDGDVLILNRVPYTLETVDQKAHHNSRHFNKWMSNDQACPSVRIVGRESSSRYFFFTRFHEWRTTVNAHPSVSAYFHETITNGTSTKKYIPGLCGNGRRKPLFPPCQSRYSAAKRYSAAINSKWTPIKRDDQKFNGMFEMFASVTFLL